MHVEKRRKGMRYEDRIQKGEELNKTNEEERSTTKRNRPREIIRRHRPTILPPWSSRGAGEVLANSLGMNQTADDEEAEFGDDDDAFEEEEVRLRVC